MGRGRREERREGGARMKGWEGGRGGRLKGERGGRWNGVRKELGRRKERWRWEDEGDGMGGRGEEREVGRRGQGMREMMRKIIATSILKALLPFWTSNATL